MPNTRLLDRLCALCGIETEYLAASGETVRILADTRRALLKAMGVAVEPQARLPKLLSELEDRDWLRMLPPVRVLGAEEEAGTVEITLPVRPEQTPVFWCMTLEDGGRRDGRIDPVDLPIVGQRRVRDGLYQRYALALPELPPPGYHRLSLRWPEAGLGESMVLIVAPSRCYSAPVLAGNQRVFGLSLPLYAVRSQRNWGMGDFTDLKGLVDYAADRGAALVRLAPLTALRPAAPACGNPYEPSTRLFFHALYLDLEAVPEYAECEAVQRRVADPEFQARLRSLRADEGVDCREVAALKLDTAALLFAHFRARHLLAGSPRGAEFRVFRAERGEALERQALFEALSEHFIGENPELAAWTDWPAEYRDPDSEVVREFRERYAERVDFYAWLYWQADLQCEAAGRRSLEVGLSIGLCQDFVFDASALGGEVWSARGLHVEGVRLGAPPLEADGAVGVSGLAPFLPRALEETAYAPFIAALRRNMHPAGALLLRGIAGLWRQFWVPEAAGEGAWVQFPAEDLLGILALESQRNGCMVLAEEAAGLPDDFAEALERAGILPFHSLFAEADDPRGFSAREPLHGAAVAAGAMDEPTLRGFWLGRDLEEKTALRLYASESERHEQAVARAVARVRLLVALEREGLLPAEVGIHPVAVPDLGPELLIAVHRYLGRAPARIVLVRMEDALAQADPVALPGAPADYPNWRRKLPLEFEQWRKDPLVSALTDAMAEVRSGTARIAAKPRPAGLGGVVFTVPRATYRLQLHREFGFRQAAELVPFLQELGISHCYTSPYLKARPGSTHGYDIVDHGALNPELGSRADFDHFVRELARRGMGHILDLVPNHMGVMGSDNAWWLDVLENGEASEYAGFFDIEWSPVKEYLRGKVLLPTLGSPYGTALENGEIELVFDPEEGSFSAWYGPHRFPVDPREYPRVLGWRLEQLEAAVGPESPDLHEFQSLVTAFGHLPGRWQTAEARRSERLRDKEVHKRHLARLCAESQDVARFVSRNVAEFNGTPGVPSSFDRLHDLLEHQAYRLAYWRVAADEINYRRFFDINDLAALSMENEDVFDRTHGLVLGLIGAGKLHGLRIDHPDGLYDPEAYFLRLQGRIAGMPGQEEIPPSPPFAKGGTEPERRFYVVVEKILEADEELPNWPVQGTTGYDFTNLVNGLFVWPEAEPELDGFYRSFRGFPESFDELLYQSKRLILRVALTAELTVLANRLSRIAEADRRTRDYSLIGLRDALREVISCFPVYRAYISGRGVAERDAAYLQAAVDEAKLRSSVGDLSVFDFIRDVLLMVQAEGKSERYREQVLSFAMKFQQVTGPTMAKGMEDTAFYRYQRLLSLNEVGGDPRRFSVSVEEFHARNRERAERWPHALLSTSTHDTKRSEDVRARINVLSEIPDEWTAAVRRWSALNRSLKVPVNGKLAPSYNDEYFIYQTLVGSWPLGEPDGRALAEYRGRLEDYFVKALREAKLFSSWLNPNEAYERAVMDFLIGLLDASDGSGFLRDFLAFQAPLLRPGFINSLAQLVLKLTVPGVPDLYQGNELWDFSLVDPDNRRPVDYRRRRALLQEIRGWDGYDADRLAECLARMTGSMEDGRIKLYATREVLKLRRQEPELFREGDYLGLKVTGEKAGHVCAFVRRFGGRTVLVLVPRWTRRLLGDGGSLGEAAIWAGTRVVLPEELAGGYRNVFTRERVELGEEVELAGVLGRFPVGVWVGVWVGVE